MAIRRTDMPHRWLPLVLSLSALLLVGAVLAGWLLGVEVLVRGAPNRAAMVPSTAITFGLLFSGLLIHLQRQPLRGAVLACAAIAAGVALTNSIVIQLGGGGLDVLAETRAPSDRMSPGTIAGLIVAALGLAGLCSARLCRAEVPVLSAMAGLSGIVAVLFVHNFHRGSPLALPFVEAMSIYTALCLLIFFAALLLVALDPSAERQRRARPARS
ncbi:hypothetical protein CLG85_006115 [Yangia mangrovi]|uniref:Uncharacterized protein n=2 Tax=Alloyangia mangrovi TaxID=1779329 RepID=A0ABT2KHU0_9RHOB|nr:hypothetical protein [Alloyangia mangrovi]MCT4369931.1 hypothetical protein [Alloyangia mangrovi]